MRIEQFEYLLEISQNKSMNAASKNLHISPQALSNSIKKLEDELGLTILERTSMGVSLTPDGKSLLLLIENFLSGLNDLQGKPSQKCAPLYGSMHLSIPYGFTETYLPELLKAIYSDSPEIEVTATPYCYSDIINRVHTGLEEYGLTYKIFINGIDVIQDIPDDLSFTTLFKTKFFCAVPNNFSISKYKSISLKTILNFPIIMYEPANYLMSRIYNYAGTPSRIINVPSMKILSTLVAEGLGLTFSMYNYNIEKYATQFRNNVNLIHFKENITAEFGYIKKIDEPLREDSLLQIDYLTKFFKS